MYFWQTIDIIVSFNLKVKLGFSFAYKQKARSFIIGLNDKGFNPEYVGKINSYLFALDELVKHKTERPSIGIILI